MNDLLAEELLREHIDGFIITFVSKAQRQRWRTLLDLNEKRWRDIDVHGFKGNFMAGLSYAPTPRASLSSKALNLYLDTNVIVLRLGHSRETGVIVAPLREAIKEYDIVFEGVISVVAGKLVIVINHDDETIICESS